MIIKTYTEFIERVEELGFMPFSSIIEGWTSLTEETLENQWHTGVDETDPWQWKDRAAMDKKLAFGCILNGNKGFVSKKWYSFFYSAYHPDESFDVRWESGKLNNSVIKVWQLFSDGSGLGTDEIRNNLSVSGKAASGSLDKAICFLQQEYFITVSGNKRKLNKKGEPYGWPVNTYARVEDWVPSDWDYRIRLGEKKESREKILQMIYNNCARPDIKRISKVMGF